eukprot:CAMPEP_0170644086 /NCGR_PEP_ID=MMETSP0224-20130122/42274_1 /TAXON_ID=285029 /ORGANISM="Togula jolla, Strain CCCM 725" /LENGTH=144 /DNA_ID=CAMNT_0010975043 /DNA_START=519 /DNA_END=952 /DNA_ORIENTATION=+
MVTLFSEASCASSVPKVRAASITVMARSTAGQENGSGVRGGPKNATKFTHERGKELNGTTLKTYVKAPEVPWETVFCKFEHLFTSMVAVQPAGIHTAAAEKHPPVPAYEEAPEQGEMVMPVRVANEKHWLEQHQCHIHHHFTEK